MNILATVLVGFVALEHFGFLVLEMFLWNTPRGRRIFAITEAFAAESAGLAKNQGLYNGFLAAGLVWGLTGAGPSVARFFLGCVVIAGVYGSITAKRSILFVQGVPAALALAATFF